MRRPKAFLTVIGSTMVLALLIWFCLGSTGTSHVAFELPDGTTMNLRGAKEGKVFRFYEGKPWQKFLFALCHTNLPMRYSGEVIKVVPAQTNGALVLQFGQDFGWGGFLTSDALRSQMSLQLIEPDKKVEGKVIRQYLRWAILDGRCRTYHRTMYWEFPVTKEQQLHFCLSYSNTNSQKSSTNLFTIKNPAFERK